MNADLLKGISNTNNIGDYYVYDMNPVHLIYMCYVSIFSTTRICSLFDPFYGYMSKIKYLGLNSIYYYKKYE